MNDPLKAWHKTRRDLAIEFAKTMQCNCDFDRWQPEATTGHSHVCRIHKAAMDKARDGWA